MGTHAEAFRHALPAAARVVAGECRRNRDHLTPGPCCLGFKDAPERCPARIADAFGEVGVPDQIADLQVFQIDHIVLAHQAKRRLMVEITPLPLDLLMLLRALSDGLPPSRTPPLAARQALLGFRKLFLGFAVMAGGSHPRPPPPAHHNPPPAVQPPPLPPAWRQACARRTP